VGDDVRESTQTARTGQTAARRLRVAYVYRNFNRNGSIESVFVRQAERLARDEDVTVFCSAANRVATAAPLRFADVEPISRGKGRFRYAAECASFAHRSTRLLTDRRDEFDVVHVEGTAALAADLVTVHAVRPAEMEHYFANVQPRPRVRRLVNTYVLRPQSGVVVGIERRLFSGFPLCLTPTQQIKDDLDRVYGVPGELVEVVPYPVAVERTADEPLVRARLRAEQGTPEDRLVVLFVGEDFARKGLGTAIESIARSTSSAELWVVGGGQAETFRDLARRLGVLERVRFLGRRPPHELCTWYAAGDVLVLPSRQDAWGLPVVEAMAASRVAVASEYAGAHEAIEDGVTGFVVAKEGGAGEIAALLDGPLSDPELRAKVGERAARAADRFTFDSIYPRAHEAYHRAHELRRSRMPASQRRSA
jgi:UDP-glucose:(heptosyl)LPS alpha-1,3-glucosyltransferase